jgi:YbbR domain-containing protein
VLEDFWPKLISLAVAVMLWFTISFSIKNDVPISALARSTATQKTFTLPVVILSSAADVRAVRVDPQEVEVTVQGEPKVVAAVRSNEIRALVDLTGVAAAQDLHQRIEVATPSGVTHVRVFPPNVRVIYPARIRHDMLPENKGNEN